MNLMNLMNRIVASIKLGDMGPQVANLQDALRLARVVFPARIA